MSGHDENEHVRDTGPENHAGVKLKDFNIIWNAAIETAIDQLDKIGHSTDKDIAIIKGLKK